VIGKHGCSETALTQRRPAALTIRLDDDVLLYANMLRPQPALNRPTRPQTTYEGKKLKESNWAGQDIEVRV